MRDPQLPLFDLPPDLSPKFERVHLRVRPGSQIIDQARCIKLAVELDLPWASWWPVACTDDIDQVTCINCKEGQAQDG